MSAQQIVSILCPSYNHEKYICFFLDSLLAQTNPNWELIIVDDCSTDNNVAEIKKYTDARIKLIQNQFNMGINCGLNKAFMASAGQYISFCASDDMLCPDYVENVLNNFAHHPNVGVLYSNLQLIDNNNKLLNQKFYNKYLDRYSALRCLFMKENCMLSPGMVVKRDLFKKIYPLDIPMSQYQDYKMHIDLLLQADFMVMDKISVLYRKNDSQSGISAYNEITTRRRYLEENLLMDSYLKIHDVKLLRNIFATDLDGFGKISGRTIPFVLGQLAMMSSEKYKKIWGYNQISKFINNPSNYTMVNKLYGFAYKDFLGLAAVFDRPLLEIKYKKYKQLFNISICVLIGLMGVLFYILVLK